MYVTNVVYYTENSNLIQINREKNKKNQRNLRLWIWIVVFLIRLMMIIHQSPMCIHFRAYNNNLRSSLHPSIYLIPFVICTYGSFYTAIISSTIVGSFTFFFFIFFPCVVFSLPLSLRYVQIYFVVCEAGGLACLCFSVLFFYSPFPIIVFFFHLQNSEMNFLCECIMRMCLCVVSFLFCLVF